MAKGTKQKGIPKYRTIEVLPLRKPFDKANPFTRIHNDILKCEEIGIYEKMVYICLEMHMMDKEFCFPSVETIASYIGCSRSTVYNALKILEANNLILIDDSVFFGDNAEPTTAYRVYHFNRLHTPLNEKKLPLRDSEDLTKIDLPLSKLLLKRVTKVMKNKIRLFQLYKDFPNEKHVVEKWFEIIIDALNSGESYLGGTNKMDGIAVQHAKDCLDNLNYDIMKLFIEDFLATGKESGFDIDNMSLIVKNNYIQMLIAPPLLYNKRKARTDTKAVTPYGDEAAMIADLFK